MTNRRGFLQSIGAALGSTMLPGSTVASVLTAAPAASGVATVAAVAAVARQFKTSVVLDPQTFEPKMAVAMVCESKSQYLGTDFRIEPIMDEHPEMYDSDEQSKKRVSLMVIRATLEKNRLPPLTDEEAALIMA